MWCVSQYKRHPTTTSKISLFGWLYQSEYHNDIIGIIKEGQLFLWDIQMKNFWYIILFILSFILLLLQNWQTLCGCWRCVLRYHSCFRYPSLFIQTDTKKKHESHLKAIFTEQIIKHVQEMLCCFPSSHTNVLFFEQRKTKCAVSLNNRTAGIPISPFWSSETPARQKRASRHISMSRWSLPSDGFGCCEIMVTSFGCLVDYSEPFPQDPPHSSLPVNAALCHRLRAVGGLRDGGCNVERVCLEMAMSSTQLSRSGRALMLPVFTIVLRPARVAWAHSHICDTVTTLGNYTHTINNVTQYVTQEKPWKLLGE